MITIQNPVIAYNSSHVWLKDGTKLTIGQIPYIPIAIYSEYPLGLREALNLFHRRE